MARVAPGDHRQNNRTRRQQARAPDSDSDIEEGVKKRPAPPASEEESTKRIKTETAKKRTPADTPDNNGVGADLKKDDQSEEDQSTRNRIQRTKRAASRAKDPPEVLPTIKEERASRRRGDAAGKGSRAETADVGKKETDAAAAPPVSRGNELDFGLHMQRNVSMTFDVASRALLKTLRSTKHIDLASDNFPVCAECRGGGDLLCCDCCPLAFHADCLEPLERPSNLFVPIARHGLKSGPPDPEEDNDGRPLRLRESEWYCPYCLSGPIVRHWKRGVPQFLLHFDGGASELWQSGSLKKELSSSSTTTRRGNVVQWMSEVTDFVSSLTPETAPRSPIAFPPNVLLALSGIRRAIQRHGALYNALSKREKDRQIELDAEQQQAANISDTSTEQAEPDNVKLEPVQKPHIMGGRRSSKQLSDEMNSGTENTQAPAIPLKEPTRRSTRRAQQVMENKKAAARDEVDDDEEDVHSGQQAKVNVGAGFQVPGVNKFFLEAKEFGLNYSAMDERSVLAYLPMDYLGRVPVSKLHTGSTCRLVYSATELEKRRERGGTHVPLTDQDLVEYIKQAIAMWPSWIQWPPTQEFALKLLHHCRYDSKAALQLLCSDALQFRTVCDPPVKPYMNKWAPRDKRGHLPSVPFPPPSSALSMMGLGTR